MADLNGGGSTSPADDRPGANDMRSAILSAFDDVQTDIQAEADERAAAKSAPANDADETVEGAADADAAADGRTRDEKGRFKPKDGETDAGDKPAETEAKAPDADKAKPEGAEKAAADAEAKPAEQQKTDPRAPPANWKQSDKDMYSGLPDDAKDFLLRRHKEMEADHTKKTQAVATLKAEFEPVSTLFAPHRDLMTERGFTPASMVEAWLAVEKRLVDGDGVNVIRNLAGHYRIPPEQIIRALGYEVGGGPNPAGTGNGAANRDGEIVPTHQQQHRLELPPEVTAILQEVPRLKQRLEADERAKADAMTRAQAAAVQRQESEIETFKSAQDDKGNLLHPYFAEVEQDMADLAAMYVQRKQAIPPLSDLYNMAVRANPATYEALRTAETRSARAREQEAARAKAAAAKRASASVTGAPSAGQAPAQRIPSTASLRETLLAAADEHASVG